MRYFLTTCLTMLIVSALSAQQMTAQTYIQQTVMGVQKGFGLRTHQKGWGVGVVFQSTQFGVSEAGTGNYPMIAVEGIIPIASSGKLSFSLTPKVGVVNEQFIAFIPEVETTMRLTNWVYLGVGTGIRAREAATSLKIIIKAPKI